MAQPQLPQRVATQLKRATDLQPKLNAFTHLTSLRALEAQHAAAQHLDHSDTSRGQGKSMRLTHQTIAVKDCFATLPLRPHGELDPDGQSKHAPTTCGSNMLKDYASPFEATVVRRLREHGALIMGKTNMDEFGMGSSTTNSYFGSTLNPSGPHGVEASLRSRSPGSSSGSAEDATDDRRVPGGSSGGSAAAVAAGLCDFALATDTGGSTRLPASYCSIVGFKPSYGLLSRFGVVAYASSLDTVGVMAKTVAGVREVFDVLNTPYPDPRDPTSAPSTARRRARELHEPLLDRLRRKENEKEGGRKLLEGIRIGVVADLFPHPLSSSSPIRLALRTLKQDLGATLVPVRLKSAPLALGAYYVLASAEAGSNLGRFRGVEFGSRAEAEDGDDQGAGPAEKSQLPLFAEPRSRGFGKEVRKRILLGTFALSAEAFDNYYLQAQRIRLMIQRETDSLFTTANPLRFSSSSSSQNKTEDGGGGVDFLIHPSSLSTAPLLSSYTSPSPSSSSSSSPAPTNGTNYIQDLVSLPASLAGLPALQIPVGKDEGDGWPLGMTLVGQWGADEGVLEVGERLERTLGSGWENGRGVEL